ncbi:MAG: type IV pilus assembly protein PilM [Candidatus Doudnabacteria bacterium]|nr:type IV pilus assembly protein PilM [Candidatus Doudnabacteria bacterium]
MKFNFLSKNLPAFGLDVSNATLKIAQFHGNKKESILKGFGEVSLPKGMIINDAVTDGKTFNFLVKQILQKPQFGKIDTNFVVASLPESKSFVRVIQIPLMSEKEAENAVPFEAESFIPLPIDQVYLDWQKIGETGDKMNILMVASPKQFVDGFLETLERAGLKVVALEVESQSCHRAVIPQDSKETVLIVDISASRSSLIMVEEGNLQFTSTIPIGGNAFTESIARTMGVSSSKAEEIKRKVGISNTTEYPNIRTVVLPVLNNLSAEIKNILKFHNEHSEKQVSSIILAGGSAKLKNLIDFLAPQMQEAGVAKVELANPWQNLPGLKTPQMESLDSLGYVTAIGLAHRGMNFDVY